MAVLALQGAFREHLRALQELNADAYPARTAADLAAADAIVLPGGESTTMDKLLRKFDMRAPLAARIASGVPVLATCAGVILLAEQIHDGLPDQVPLGLLPVSVRRNGYGRQLESFEGEVDLAGDGEPFPGVFIRAPVLQDTGSAEVIATLGGRPVGVQKGNLMALAFHPELSADLRLHRRFLELVRR